MTIQHVCFEELLFDFRNVVAGDDPWQFIRVYNLFNSNTVIPGVKIDRRGKRSLDGQFLKCEWEGRIPARVYTRHGNWSAEFDAVPFFIGASRRSVKDLVETDGGEWTPAPEVASFMADLNYNVWQIINQGELHGEEVSCEIDRTAMIEWLERNHADTWGRVRTTPLQVVRK